MIHYRRLSSGEKEGRVNTYISNCPPKEIQKQYENAIIDRKSRSCKVGSQRWNVSLRKRVRRDSMLRRSEFKGKDEIRK
jgi:hypothetical protein